MTYIQPRFVGGSMTKKTTRMAFIVAVFASLLFICKGQTGAGESGKTYNVGGTKITVLTRPEMNVNMTPQRLDAGLGSAMFYYRLKVTGKKAAQELRWDVYVVDGEGRVVAEAGWRDVGDWRPGSEKDNSALIYYDNAPGVKLTIILSEVADETGVRKIGKGSVKQNLGRILAGTVALPESKFSPHAEVSEVEGKDLFKRSLKLILADNDFRRYIKLAVPTMLLMPDSSNAAPPLPDIQLISEELVKEKLRVGEAINYLQYKGLKTDGDLVRVYFQYHTPRIVANGTAYVDTGLNITFTYQMNKSRYTSKGVETEYF